MEKKLISIQEAMKKLNISAVGLDNNIKKKGFKKHYSGRQAFITIEDFEVIKRTVELNGRVKKIKDKDNEDFELLKRKEELEKENEKLKNTIQSLSTKIKSTYNATIDLKKDKDDLRKDRDDLKALLEQSNNNLIAAQKLLQNEQELHRQEKARRIALEDKVKESLLLAENASKNKEEADIKIEKLKNINAENQSVITKLEGDLIEIKASKEKIVSELESKEITIKEMNSKNEIAISRLEEELLEARTSKEIILSENNRYKNMKLKERIKFLFRNHL